MEASGELVQSIPVHMEQVQVSIVQPGVSQSS
jgi:hypothetical protein